MHEVFSTNRSKVKVKVTSPSKSEIRPFSNATSSLISNGGWEMTRILTLGGNTLSFSLPNF